MDDLNKGNVVGLIMDGNFDNAIKSISVNSQNLIKTTEGRKSLAQAVGLQRSVHGRGVVSLALNLEVLNSFSGFRR